MSITINLVDFRKLGPQFLQPSYVASVTELKTDLFPPITIKVRDCDDDDDGIINDDIKGDNYLKAFN